jgi:hypothetical protein
MFGLGLGRMMVATTWEGAGVLYKKYHIFKYHVHIPD